jgi:hypothetical protein
MSFSNLMTLLGCVFVLLALTTAAIPFMTLSQEKWLSKEIIEHINQNGVFVAMAAGFGFLAVFCFWLT